MGDFRSAQDHIDLAADSGIGIHAFTDLKIEVVGPDSIIHIDANNDIKVLGVNDLQASDFHFG